MPHGSGPLIHIRTLATGPVADVSKRGLNRALTDAHRAVGQTWERDFLKLHFRHGNATRYQMKQRTLDYIKKKKRLAGLGIVEDGGFTNLVFQGNMKRMLLGKLNVTRAFPTRASVKMFGPDYLHINPKNPNMPNMAAEILKVIPEERAVLDAVAHKQLGESLARETAMYQARHETK